MNAEEFEALAAVERTHWFYRGKRKIVIYWLKRLGLSEVPGEWVVDVGAGTGILLSELQADYKTLGVEYSSVGLKFAKTKTTAQLMAGSAKALPLATSAAGAAIALDVIEHIDDDRQAVSEIARVVRPGGYIILSVPAFQRLWSDWDVALGHLRRYSGRSLLRVVQQRGLLVRHMAYLNWLAFLPIIVYRRWRTLVPSASRSRLEDGVPPAWLNRLLEAAFVRPACWPWFKPPVGVSLFCILEKSWRDE